MRRELERTHVLVAHHAQLQFVAARLQHRFQPFHDAQPEFAVHAGLGQKQDRAAGGRLLGLLVLRQEGAVVHFVCLFADQLARLAGNAGPSVERLGHGIARDVEFPRDVLNGALHVIFPFQRDVCPYCIRTARRNQVQARLNCKGANAHIIARRWEAPHGKPTDLC